jgi:hypothetical protein
MTTIFITRDALTTGVITARSGMLATALRWHGGRRWAAEDYHTTIESAFARVRRMVESWHDTHRKWVENGLVKPGTLQPERDRLDAIEAGLDRGELPMAKAAGDGEGTEG